MPIHDVGYRKWLGDWTPLMGRWWIITEAGIKINLRNNWIKRTILLALLPTFVAAIGIFFVEKLLEQFNNTAPVIFTLETGEDVARATRLERFNLIDVDNDGLISGSEADRVNLHAELRGMDANLDGYVDRLEFMLGTPELYMNYLYFRSFAYMFPNFEAVDLALQSGNPRQLRTAMWSWILLNFFRSFQGIGVVLLVGLIVPPLIAQDVRSRAFQLYYARPITRKEYIVGKLGIPAFFVFLITAAPAIVVYCFGVMMSPDLSVLLDTWQVPLRIVVASIVLILPTCSLALMFSSLTFETRFATFAWFAVWGLGIVAWSIIEVTQFSMMDPEISSVERQNSKWAFVSLFNIFYRVQGWIFGMETRTDFSLLPFGILVVITVVSIIVLSRRVAATLRA
ncbi:MAG TPA: ABC transporter permease subunit [Pirellulaceae bacterium]|nr:ABC transporter permease subunit [Pirellulaceae bacterium]HMO93535.1 ABC transporter permease subunit [Pirellulaceae bacterium]HMP70353.1 ABC transporter permease subunit [Pirellulaceae bacterium]